MFLQIWVTHTHPFSPTNMTPHRSSSTTDVNLGHGYVVKTSSNERAGIIGHDADLHRCDLQSRDNHPRQRRQRLSPCWDRCHWVHTRSSQLRFLGNNTQDWGPCPLHHTHLVVSQYGYYQYAGKWTVNMKEWNVIVRKQAELEPLSEDNFQVEIFSLMSRTHQNKEQLKYLSFSL